MFSAELEEWSGTGTPRHMRLTHTQDTHIYQALTIEAHNLSLRDSMRVK